MLDEGMSLFVNRMEDSRTTKIEFRHLAELLVIMDLPCALGLLIMQMAEVESLVRKVNFNAKVIRARHCEVDLNMIINTNR